MNTIVTVALPDISLDLPKAGFIAAVSSSAIDPKSNLVGFQGDFIFDSRVITFENEPVRKAGLTSGSWNVSGNVLPGLGPIRILRVSAYSEDFNPLAGEGTLFELKIRRANKGGQSSQLIWASGPSQFIFIDAGLHVQKPGSEEARKRSFRVNADR